jgi:SOS-response transcriptional repressor LexA
MQYLFACNQEVNMGESIGKTISKLRINAGFLKAADLSKVSGVSSGTLSRIENDQVRPNPSTLDKLAPFLGVSYESLLVSAGYLTESNDDNSYVPDEPSDVIERPVFSKIYSPIFTNENRDVCDWEYIPNRYNGQTCVYYRMPDSSMEKSRIRKGDYLLIRLQPALKPGEIGAFFIKNEPMVVKRYYKIKDKVLLFSDDQDEDEISIFDVGDVRIYGRVIRIVSNLV